MCFWTRVWRQLRSDLWEGDGFHLQPWARERERDMLTQTNRTFLGCYLSVSRVFCTLECAFSVFSSPPSLLFSSVPRDHLLFGLFSGSFSHTNLNSTLLAPYYHISDRLGCVVITNEVLKFIATKIMNTFSPLAGLLDVEQQINTEPLQLTVC